MKKIKILGFASVTLLTLLGMFWFDFASASSEVEIRVSVSRKEFQLGEIVPVDIAVKNVGRSNMQVSGPCIKVATKTSSVYSSYLPPRTLFMLDGIDIPLILSPGEQKTTQQSVLWNDKPQVSHLNEDAARSEKENKILSDYAFPKSGDYLIRGCTALLINGKWKVVDSEPIEITVNDPEGEDLEVWNMLKRNGNIAYFMQVGDVPRKIQYNSEERESLLREIDRLVADHPQSAYSVVLRQRLKTFRTFQQKRLDPKSLKQSEPL